MTGERWPTIETILTPRLCLEPMQVDDAEVMAPLLADPSLHDYIGGQPATVEELRERYARLVIGHSADGTQGWLNWIVRQSAARSVVGTVQVTLAVWNGRTCAEMAWVIAAPHQRMGYASEAVAGLAGWLLSNGAQVLVAHVHPDHRASQRVARAAGLSPTAVTVDGETRWSNETEAADPKEC